MKIAVRSKGGAKDFRCEQPWVAISIATYDGEHPVLSEDSRIGLLQLAFRDTDFEQDGVFTKNQARQVIEFVESIIHKAEFLLIHCEMGMSRSPGMAAALSKLYAGVDQYWFERYTPNRMVYRKLIEAAIEYDEKFLTMLHKMEKHANF